MSDDETITVDTSDTQLLTAEYKNGQLEIVEVTSFDKTGKESHILPDAISSEDHSGGSKYMQVIGGDKGLVQLDLLNLTLVRCEDGEEAYRLVSNSESDGGELPSDATVACVLQSSDGEDQDNQDSYVMVEGSDGPLMFLQPAAAPHRGPEPKPMLTPAEILEKAKALQKAKALLVLKKGRAVRGRKRRGDLPPPHELLSSPNFKLFLYSCKSCSFKCNAVKELTAHKAMEHGSGSKAARAGGGAARGAAVSMQCARCPFRGGSHSQLMKHVHEKHASENNTNSSNKVSLNTKEVQAADVLVCGACGFESASRILFRRHIELEHGATTT